MSCTLERWRRDPVFVSQPSPTLLLSRDFTIAAASRSYLQLTGRTEDQLIALNVFEAFPESPDCATAGATTEFAESCERVLRTRRCHRLEPIRYDVEDAEEPGAFTEKTWAVVNAPVADGDTAGVMVRTEDLTPLSGGLLTALRAYREVLVEADGRLPGTRRDDVDAVANAIESYTAVATEVAQLRQAMRTRAAIEQAKGMVMADRKCAADEAFALLRRLSNETNVPLAEVAAAVVYQRSR